MSSSEEEHGNAIRTSNEARIAVEAGFHVVVLVTRRDELAATSVGANPGMGPKAMATLFEVIARTIRARFP